MARLKTDEQLEAFRRQQVEIARKIKEAEARQREKAKRDEQRRQLVLGAAALDYFSQPSMIASRANFLRALFRDRKMSAADLALFEDLMAAPVNGPEPEAATGGQTVAA